MLWRELIFLPLTALVSYFLQSQTIRFWIPKSHRKRKFWQGRTGSNVLQYHNYKWLHDINIYIGLYSVFCCYFGQIFWMLQFTLEGVVVLLNFNFLPLMVQLGQPISVLCANKNALVMLDFYTPIVCQISADGWRSLLTDTNIVGSSCPPESRQQSLRCQSVTKGSDYETKWSKAHNGREKCVTEERNPSIPCWTSLFLPNSRQTILCTRLCERRRGKELIYLIPLDLFANLFGIKITAS